MRARSWVLVSTALAVGAIVAAATGGSIGGSQARAASFDCARAATATELAICANATLSALDGALGLAYDQQLALNPSIKQIERGWLKVRNVGCGRDVGCLTSLSRAQLAWLRSGAPRFSGALPTRVGLCSLTTIRLVGPRLENTPGSGSEVAEVNGAYQVSYDQIPAMDASRPGDPALVCLISVPRGCPPGDGRGRVYGVANLRTPGAWSEPDSEHECGGA